MCPQIRWGSWQDRADPPRSSRPAAIPSRESPRCPDSCLALLLLPVLACPVEPEPAGPEPLDLPEDPAESGAPVGVRTVETAALTLEIFYPAGEEARGQEGATYDLAAFVPDEVADLLGPLPTQPIATTAVRDAPLRRWEEPYPVVIFSHGFGGFRVQSFDYSIHLASRGYVVVAADHPGRMLGDILPCLFSPPLESCDLSLLGGEDPGEVDVPATLDWLEGAAAAEGGVFEGALDLDHIGLSGHSAGAGTTGRVGPVRPAGDRPPADGRRLHPGAGGADPHPGGLL